MRSRGCRWCYMSAARRRRRTLPRPASDASTPTPARCYSQLPVYIWVPEEEGQFQPGRCSRWWLAASLQALDADLRVRGMCGMAGGAPVGMCSCGVLHRFLRLQVQTAVRRCTCHLALAQLNTTMHPRSIPHTGPGIAPACVPLPRQPRPAVPPGPGAGGRGRALQPPVSCWAGCGGCWLLVSGHSRGVPCAGSRASTACSHMAIGGHASPSPFSHPAPALSSYDPISMVRDNEVKAGLAAAGVHCQSFNAEILREPWEVLAPGGKVGAGWELSCRFAVWGSLCSTLCGSGSGSGSGVRQAGGACQTHQHVNPLPLPTPCSPSPALTASGARTAACPTRRPRRCPCRRRCRRCHRASRPRSWHSWAS